MDNSINKKLTKVVITGVAGFLGSHIAQHYLEQNCIVVGVDDFTSSSPNSIHFKRLKSYRNFHFKESNLIKENFKENIFAFAQIIFNFACPASPPIYQSIPIHTMLTCVVGTKNVLEFAKRNNTIVIHASTSEVYGDPNISPQPESYKGQVNSYGPRSCYDEGKRAAEALCFDYHNQYNVDARLVRIFNTYGPHMDPQDGRVVTNFVHQALNKEPLTIYGDGSQTRSFCYVDDLIRGIITMSELNHNPKTPINLGNPFEFTMLQLATCVLNEVRGANRNIKDNDLIIFKSLPIDDPTQRKPDITLARKILNWEPSIKLEEGIKKMISYEKR